MPSFTRLVGLNKSLIFKLITQKLPPDVLVYIGVSWLGFHHFPASRKLLFLYYNLSFGERPTLQYKILVSRVKGEI